MQHALQGVALLGAALLTSGCAGLSGYLRDRGRDAADIVTCAVGVGAIAHVRAGPVPVGILDVSDVAGIKYGGVFCRKPPAEKPDEHDATLAAIAAAPVALFAAGLSGGMGSESFCGFWRDYWDGRKSLWGYENNFPLAEIQVSRKKGTGLLSSPNCYQVEGVLGLGVTLRVGLNAGELLDFILGWTTFDLFGDDIALQKEGASRPAASGP